MLVKFQSPSFFFSIVKNSYVYFSIYMCAQFEYAKDVQKELVKIAKVWVIKCLLDI